MRNGEMKNGFNTTRCYWIRNFRWKW
jgi:hypothetical protein